MALNKILNSIKINASKGYLVHSQIIFKGDFTYMRSKKCPFISLPRVIGDNVIISMAS